MQLFFFSCFTTRKLANSYENTYEKYSTNKIENLCHYFLTWISMKYVISKISDQIEKINK
jgi:hypothetical protein